MVLSVPVTKVVDVDVVGDEIEFVSTEVIVVVAASNGIQLGLVGTCTVNSGYLQSLAYKRALLFLFEPPALLSS